MQLHESNAKSSSRLGHRIYFIHALEFSHRTQILHICVYGVHSLILTEAHTN